MSVKKYSHDNNYKEKGHFNLGIFMAILVGLFFLAVAFLIANYFILEHNSSDKQSVQAQQTTGQASSRTLPQASDNGEVLNIFGQPLKEPKPKYIPVEETETDDKASAKKDEKAIYLEAIDMSNVHTEAGQDYPSVDVTEIGEKCKYLGVNEYGWLYIETEDGNKGYVYQTHFEDVDEIIN